MRGNKVCGWFVTRLGFTLESQVVLNREPSDLVFERMTLVEKGLNGAGVEARNQ